MFRIQENHYSDYGFRGAQIWWKFPGDIDGYAARW